MLSRHFLRSKVLQAVYACYTDPVDIPVAERNFKHIISRFNDLGIIQLSALVHFAEVAGVMIDEAQHKYLPTEAELNPNRRLPNNLFIQNDICHITLSFCTFISQTLYSCHLTLKFYLF